MGTFRSMMKDEHKVDWFSIWYYRYRGPSSNRRKVDYGRGASCWRERLELWELHRNWLIMMLAQYDTCTAEELPTSIRHHVPTPYHTAEDVADIVSLHRLWPDQLQSLTIYELEDLWDRVYSSFTYGGWITTPWTEYLRHITYVRPNFNGDPSAQFPLADAHDRFPTAAGRTTG